ncbi:MAG: dihydropteroate synthase [Thaumarchaeota archaeon]|nr:dihydropteroate synthase [Candidatus Calditenuaceae archaeon]MDW8187091.1 dihydropteroate synthase [Nitrososphaerota archaeon]
MRRIARIGKVEVGEGHAVAILGIINVSPESFHKASVRTDPREISETASRMVEEGVDVIDIGGASSAPYLDAEVPEDTEAARVRVAIKAVRDAVDVPVSLDTSRVKPALEGLKLGVDAINDVRGLAHLSEVLKEIADSGVSLILMARDVREGDVISGIKSQLRQIMSRALSVGIDEKRIVLDPGVGFHRNHSSAKWYQLDVEILKRLDEMRDLGRPLLVGASMKGFIGKLTGRQVTDERVFGSIASEVVAVMNGADLIRTHNVRSTLDAIRIASAVIGRPAKPLRV